MSGIKEILKRVRKLDVETRQLTEGLIAGTYRSVFRGRGIEFSQVREYVPGDDVRAIDWNVTARLNTPFVKEYIEERDLNLYVLLDISGSTSFGNAMEKRWAEAELAALLFYSAMKSNDNSGLALFTDRIECFIPARKGRRHHHRLLRELVEHEAASVKTDIGKALKRFNSMVRKKSIVFIISDFISDGHSKELRSLKARGHDVICVRVIDPLEKGLPDIGYILLQDAETGEELLLDTSDTKAMEGFRKAGLERERRFSREMKKLRLGSVSIDSGEEPVRPLKRFFRERRRRRC